MRLTSGFSYKVSLSVLHSRVIQVTMAPKPPHFCPMSCQMQTVSHLDPRCYWPVIFCLFCLSCFLFFFTLFLTLHLSFSRSLPSPASLHFSLPPSVLYGKTFLVFYSAPVKPGAYFQCPKLIANVRTDPSSRSLFPPLHSYAATPPPPNPPPFLASTVRIRGTFSWPYWTLGFYVF